MGHAPSAAGEVDQADQADRVGGGNAELSKNLMKTADSVTVLAHEMSPSIRRILASKNIGSSQRI